MTHARSAAPWWSSIRSRLATIALAGLAVSTPVLSGPITSTTSLSFETLQQSMWGPSGPSVVDTGVLFVGPQWNATLPAAHATLPFGLNIDTSVIPGTVRDFLGISNPTTIGSTSRTTVDVVASSSGKIGFDFRAILDPGSVDAMYSGLAALTATDAGPTGTGLRLLTLTSGELNPAASLMTRSPQIDIESNFITQMNAAVAVDGKWVTRPAFGKFPSGCPFDVTIVFTVEVPCAYNGQTEQSVDLNPNVHKATLLEVDDKKQLLKFTNTELTILGQDVLAAAPDSGQIEVAFDISVDVLELALLAAGGAGGVPIDVSVTDNSNPKNPRKPKDVDPTDIVDVKVSTGDLTLYAPILDTQSNQLIDEGMGPRVKTAGQTNLARIDLDADLMSSLLFAPVVPVLGVTTGIGVGPITLVSISADLLDADVGALFLGAQDFSFAPELWQTLVLSEEVRYRVGGGEWQTGNTIIAKVGDVIEIEYDPTRDFEIFPTYMLDNTFTNMTRLLGQPVFDAEILSFNLDLITPLPDPDKLVLKDFPPVPLGDPIPLATLFNGSFELAGFQPVDGERLFIAALDLSEVPEPGSLVLLVLALAFLRATRVRSVGRMR